MSTADRKCRMIGAGTISPMFSALSSFWNAMPTTAPLLNTGPPLLPLLMAASTVTARRCRWLWL